MLFTRRIISSSTSLSSSLSSSRLPPIHLARLSRPRSTSPTPTTIKPTTGALSTTTTTTTTGTGTTASSLNSKPTIMPVKATDFPQLQACLTSNAEWAARTHKEEPDFFERSAKGQKPFLLWIGCADSRVPESVVLGRKPGEIFVHRNIANQYQKGDDSAQAVLEYAVGFLGVRHVAIVGHTACGGCAAAYGSSPDQAGNTETTTSLSRFLQPLIDLRHSLPAEATMDDLIVENVRKGVLDVAKSEVIQKQWKEAEQAGKEPVYVHGWLKDLSTGLIKDLECSQGPAKE